MAMWGLIAGIVSYPPSVWLFRRLWDRQGILHGGWLRGISVFVAATILSSLLGSGVSWLTRPAVYSAGTSLDAQALRLFHLEYRCVTTDDQAVCQQAVQYGFGILRKEMRV
jgi:hypothetical protein